MDQPQSNVKQDARRDPRVPIDDEVTITLETNQLVGSGENVSAQGVYFTSTTALRVQVKIAGSGAVVPGELVRVESMGNGRFGIAVRFLPEQPAGAAPDAAG